MVEAVDKKRARLNCIAHLLTQVPYNEVTHQSVVLPERIHDPAYQRDHIPEEMFVPKTY